MRFSRLKYELCKWGRKAIGAGGAGGIGGSNRDGVTVDISLSVDEVVVRKRSRISISLVANNLRQDSKVVGVVVV